MPKPDKRSSLDTLSKPQLLEIAKGFELGVSAGRLKSEIIEAIAASKRASFESVLELLSRNDLKKICRDHDIDESGRERRVIIDRILGRQPTGAEDAGAGYQPTLAAVDVDAAYDASKRKRKRKQKPAATNGASTARMPVESYEHGGRRVNNPPVGLVTPETDPPGGKSTYRHDPHVDPVLEFDAGGGTGVAAEIDDLIDEGLASDDIEAVKAALRALKERREPYLSWAGKAERTTFEVPTVSLHVHERIDPRTIVDAVRRGDRTPAPAPDGAKSQLGLFEKPSENPPLRDAIDFYRHEHNWTNRLIAGDSLMVMNSLLEKEGMGGKVQMVYFDPPYGISYGSNFQPFVNRRMVKNKDEDLTQEPEMLKAFRDTWELGIHSYLTYLRDRLMLARDMLSQQGSCFVQIGDENLHHVREIMDDVFGAENFRSLIAVKKTAGLGTSGLLSVCDYLIWYARDRGAMKERPYFVARNLDDDPMYVLAMTDDGTVRRMTREERETGLLTADARRCGHQTFHAAGLTPSCVYPITFRGRRFNPTAGASWKTNSDGAARLIDANRLLVVGKSLRYVRYADDFPYLPLSNMWPDGASGVGMQKVYVVQTNTKLVQRCMLMTTDPGDLVFDPTCGSGTTAAVAEQWGRRWLTCDTSRVAITLAKQRLMTSTFDYYRLARSGEGVSGGFIYKTVPHVTLRSIANNPEIKPGMSRAAIDAAIAKYADQETLYDRPEVDASKLRVTGPFTVEAVPAPVVQPVSEVDAPAAGDEGVAREGETVRQAEWREELRRTGVRGKGGNVLKFVRVEPFGGARYLHADAEVSSDRGTGALAGKRVVVSFGPEHAPLEQRQVELAWEEARALEPKPALLLFAAFEFDPEAAKDIDAIPPEKAGMTLLKAKMNGDLFTDDLKKKRASNESFWLVGQPDIELRAIKKGEHKGRWEVQVRGFDYFNPRTGEIESGDTERIALWFLDPDYDGRSLYPRQVFFPMAGPKDGWARLAKSLRAEIDEERIEAYRGTESLPFERGKFARVAVKIVDDRGIESLVVREIE